jgi:2-C-methyl-D-erythritol 4-phosphate cytidylyltransferase
MNSFSFIITAGGIGKRMGTELPKQFLSVADKPILLHTLERLFSFDKDAQIILTLPQEWKNYWQEILKEHQCTIPHRVVDGGQERYHSVKNAIGFCSGNFIAIHDGVRPFVSNETFERLKEAVFQYGAVVPVSPVKESLRFFNEHGSQSIDRSKFMLVQTPQVFSKEIIQNSYDTEYHQSITDDASLVEACGFVVHTVDGNEENIKITSPLDLALAGILIEQK